MAERAAPAGPWRACRLLLGLRLRRLLNQQGAVLGSLGRKKPSDAPDKRRATPGKRKRGIALAGFMGFLFVWQSILCSYQIVQNIVRVLGEDRLAATAALLMSGLFVLLCLIGIGLRPGHLGRLDWDMEWLLTLPVSTPTLLFCKIVEQTALNFFGWFTATAFLGMLAWHWGLRWSAPLLALPLAAAFLLGVGTLRVVLEVLLRTWCPTRILRNVQGLATMLSMAGFILLFAPMASGDRPDYFIWGWLDAAGDWCLWLPGGWPLGVVWALNAGGFTLAWAMFTQAAFTGLVFHAGWRALGALTRRGLAEGAGLPQGERGRTGASARPSSLTLGGIMSKDVRLLLRDRTMLIGTLATPILVIVMQLVVNPTIFEEATQRPQFLGALAFGLGAYVLMFSAMGVMTAEGPALWLLYTLPHRVEDLMRRKALLWGALASCYTLATLAWGWFKLGPSWELLGVSAYGLTGVLLFAQIGAALGIFASDPEEKEPSRRLRPDYVYLFMLLEGLYAYGFFAPGAWAALSLLVLVVALALALWQKVAAGMPYVLDPDARPPARLSLSDGLIAVVIFFVLQGVFMAGALAAELDFGIAQFAAFGAAGLLTLGLMLYTLWRHGVPNLWATLGWQRGRGWLAACGAGLGFAAPALACGAGYLWLTRNWPFLSEYVAELTRQAAGAPDLGLWLVPLAVVAAPFCEEALFRGMIFRGMRESFGVWPSVLLSAAVFAFVHPALSVPPVFVLGVCAALAFEYGGSLVAPILVHALYNALVLKLQMT